MIRQLRAAFLFFSFLPCISSASPMLFGLGHPFTPANLPAGSHLRQNLEGLPVKAQQKALRHLHRFTFPEHDTEHLNVTDDGDVFYSDPVQPSIENAPLLQTGASVAAALPGIDVFALHSRSGAANVVYLDFDGMTITGTAWNSSVGVDPLLAAPYDTGGDSTVFDETERAAIAEIWHRIAEDYAPFNIDVTTEEPAAFGPTTGRILFTKGIDSNGNPMPGGGVGGLAYAGVWGAPNYASFYSPALVYSNSFGTVGYAEVGAHEFGHNLGLSHDGTSTQEYYNGLGTGYISWNPIMGGGVNSVTQWSKGEYPNANNPQDDVALIGAQLGFRTDDHGNDIQHAAQLLVDNTYAVTVTTPESDPGNVEPDNKGVIEQRSDIDMFYFDSPGGIVGLQVTPAWAAFYEDQHRGANLDIKATLYDQGGAVIASSDPLDNTNAVISANVAAGRYYLAITGVGNSVTPYSDYNSQGEYFISGTIAGQDTIPPNPNPMSFTAPPTAIDATQVTMTATLAVDAISAVQYQFVCTFPVGVAGCVDSAWQSGRDYTIAGLKAGGTYTFAVKAKDAAGNETVLSDSLGVTTLPAGTVNHPPVAANDTAQGDEDTLLTIPVLANDWDPDGDPLFISAKSKALHGKVSKTKDGQLTYKPAKNYNGPDSFTYTITDKRKGYSTATVNVTVLPVNDPPVAKKDKAKVAAGGTVNILVLTNDTDVDGNVLTVSQVTQGLKGTVVNNGSSISYTAGSTTGSDSFTYTVSDGNGGTATAVVKVAIK